MVEPRNRYYAWEGEGLNKHWRGTCRLLLSVIEKVFCGLRELLQYVSNFLSWYFRLRCCKLVFSNSLRNLSGVFPLFSYAEDKYKEVLISQKLFLWRRKPSIRAACSVTFVTMFSFEVCWTLAAVTTNRVNTFGSILAGIANFALIHI